MFFVEENVLFSSQARPILVFMHIDTFYLYARETVIGNIAACNTRLQAYNEHVYSPKIGRKTIKKEKKRTDRYVQR